MIVGAGLAGLIAAHSLPGHKIYEQRAEPVQAHRAVLRFRSSAVGELTGVDFRPVTVRKGIWHESMWHPATINLANMYSRKVIGRVIDRSIWDLAPATRWVAPDNFYFRLVNALSDRIKWGTAVDFALKGDEPTISTAPLPVVLDSLGIERPVTFDRAPITVARFNVPNCDVYQTVYYPTAAHSMYRATITGNLLICEFSGEPTGDWLWNVHESFGVSYVTALDDGRQEYGKIAPINDNVRKALLTRLTSEYNIFSLGRFATWRNILLDDVVHDIAIVKRLITASAYERRLESIA